MHGFEIFPRRFKSCHVFPHDKELLLARAQTTFMYFHMIRNSCWHGLKLLELLLVPLSTQSRCIKGGVGPRTRSAVWAFDELNFTSDSVRVFSKTSDRVFSQKSQTKIISAYTLSLALPSTPIPLFLPTILVEPSQIGTISNHRHHLQIGAATFAFHLLQIWVFFLPGGAANGDWKKKKGTRLVASARGKLASASFGGSLRRRLPIGDGEREEGCSLSRLPVFFRGKLPMPADDMSPLQGTLSPLSCDGDEDGIPEWNKLETKALRVLYSNRHLILNQTGGVYSPAPDSGPKPSSTNNPNSTSSFPAHPESSHLPMKAFGEINPTVAPNHQRIARDQNQINVSLRHRNVRGVNGIRHSQIKPFVLPVEIEDVVLGYDPDDLEERRAVVSGDFGCGVV
ncbi:hypothetical protein LXL04_033696 [Taraxacum kok-saghyz]